MGWLDSKKQQAKDRVKQAVNDVTHATCYRCGEESLKTAMVHENKWGTDRWRCRASRACEKRRSKNATEGSISHRRTSKEYRNLGKSGQGWGG